MLERYIPHYQGIDYTYVANFRKRAIKYLLTHNNKIDSLTQEEAEQLGLPSKITAADEVIDIDDDIVSTNIRALFQEVMQGDPSTWSAIHLLETQEQKINGFVFKVKKI